MDILYIANAVPYNKIRHAGGKTFHYYVKELLDDGDFHVTVIGLCKQEETKDFDAKIDGLDCRPIITRGSFWKNVQRVLYDLWGICSFRKRYSQSYYKTANILKEAKRLQKEGFRPDIIELEWTNMVLMIDAIKKIFPEAKYVASEHDVSFLGAERRYRQAAGVKKHLKYRQYCKLKEQELRALQKSDIIMPQNYKDKSLLIENGIESKKVFILTPYYHNMCGIVRKNVNHDILFWGAMYREENYQAAFWFIQNVMPLLEDTDVRFIIAGNKPPDSLKACQCDRIIVTGFVEDEVPLFASSMCFVSPLISGAGIKVKVIEALSAGIPILTNDIGIEGIPAEDGVSYFHCSDPKDYENVIRKLLAGEIDGNKLMAEQRNLIEEDFSLNASANEFKAMLQSLAGKDE